MIVFIFGMIFSTLLWTTPSTNAADSDADFVRRLGNLTYARSEKYQPIGSIKSSYGHSSVAMVNGYMLAVYSSDSGGNLDDGGISIWDVSNPRLPVRVNNYDNGVTHELREAHSLSFSSSYTDASGRQRDYVALQAMHGLQIWDVTDIPDIQLVKYKRLPGIREDDYFGAWWIFWQAPYIYLAGVEQGLYIIDASDIKNMELVSQVSTGELGGINPAQAFVVGNMMVLGSNVGAELATVDISDPVKPKVINKYTGRDAYSHIFAAGKIIGSGGRRAVPKMYVYNVTHDGQISYHGSGGDGFVANGGYGSYQDGYFISGFSQGVYKFDVEKLELDGGWKRVYTHRDYDFGMVMGNLIFAGDDHEGVSEFVVHNTQKDRLGPAVHWIHPADGASLLPPTTRVGLSMSDNVDISSVNGQTFSVRPVTGPAISGKFSSQMGIVNFSPDEPLLPGMTYNVVVEGIEDYSGNPAPRFTSRFTVGNPQAVELDCAVQTEPVEVGSQAVFSGPDNPNGTIYQWSFGDGSASGFSTSKNVSKTYAEPGRFPLSLMVQWGSVRERCSAVQVVYNRPTAAAATHSASIILTDERILNVNPDNNTVTALDRATLVKLWEAPVGENPTTLAQAPNGDIWVANQQSDTISVLHPANGNLLRTILLDYGATPHSLAFAPDGSAAYVTFYQKGELAKLDLIGSIQARLAVGPTPRSLAISGDSGRILVSRYISTGLQGEVVEVDAGPFSVKRTHPLHFDPGPDSESNGRGLPNYLGQIAISPDGLQAIVPSKKDNIARGDYRDGRSITFESQVRSIVSQIDLTTNVEIKSARVDLDNESLPQSAVFSPLGDLFMVANMGSNAVQFFDSRTSALVGRVQTDFAPQGLILDDENKRLLVHNFLSRTVTSYDVTDLLTGRSNGATPFKTVELVRNERLSDQVLTGKRVFYNASDKRMGQDSYMSCATCHISGGSDGQVWDTTQNDEGERNTQSLNGLAGLAHGNLHWSGNFDELQDVENEIRARFGGIGFLTNSEFEATRNLEGEPKAGKNPDLDALAAYVASLDEFGRSPLRAPHGGQLTAEGVLGRDLFKANSCASCHAGEPFTDSPAGSRHQIGSLGQGTIAYDRPLAGFQIDTPTLRGLWSSGPYLHNGSADTLAEAIKAHVWTTFSANDLDLLTAYLNQIDDGEPAARNDFLPSALALEPAFTTRTSNVGEAVSIQLTASGGGIPTFGSRNLPPGLTLNPATGEIMGRLLNPGHYRVAIFVTDGQGGVDVAEFDWVVDYVAQLTGRTHLCKQAERCEIDLGWVQVTVPANSFGQDVVLQITHGRPPFDIASVPSERLLAEFWLLAADAQTGKIVESLAGRPVQVAYHVGSRFFGEISTNYIDVVTADLSAADWQMPAVTTADGAVVFEMGRTGRIGLLNRKHEVFLPVVQNR